jgi:hypothetical protein
MIVVSLMLATVILSIGYLIMEENIVLETAKMAFLNKQSIITTSSMCPLDRYEPSIESILNAESPNFYYVLYGLNGIGKTQYMSERARQIPHALYYSVEHSDNLPENLYSHIFEKERGLVLRIFDLFKQVVLKFRVTRSHESNLNDIFKFFKENRNYFVGVFNTTPIIIIDNVNLYSSLVDFVDALENMLQNSKSIVDLKALKLILISSEGSLPKIISESSTSSRLKTVFISEITKEQTIKFLRCYLERKKNLIVNFTDDAYEEIFNNIGGHMLYLLDFCDSYAVK